jgi:hypothetical protein
LREAVFTTGVRSIRWSISIGQIGNAGGGFVRGVDEDVAGAESAAMAA